jgi:APA family basic amino acid/polyamine antiporter
MYAMGQDGALPQAVTKTTKNGTPIASLSIFAAITLITLFFAKTFDKILNYTVFLDCIATAFAAACIFILRKKVADEEAVYKVRPYPVLPILFIAAFLFVAGSIFEADPFTAIMGIGIFVSIFILYILWMSYGKVSARKK